MAQAMIGIFGRLRPLVAAGFAFTGSSCLFFLSFVRGCCSQSEAGLCMPDHAHEVEGRAHASGWSDVEHETKP